MELTSKEEAFALELSNGKSQRQAYRAAYNAKNMKDSTVDEKASRLLAKDKVRARYDELRGKVVAAAEEKGVASAVQVLEELTRIALGTKGFPSYTADGGEVEKKPNLSARLKALELLGKNWALFTDKTEQSGETTVRVILEGEAGELAK